MLMGRMLGSSWTQRLLIACGFSICGAAAAAAADGVVGPIKTAQTALLTAAMFALGAGVHIAALRRVGPRPLILATLSTVWVSSIALAGAVLAR
ncbi:hypothetical protein KHQ06_19685 [Nocardia tengchongensis]|uniref:Uncharacterized protein n=1 Tax=Nocardia tengchongensis TaxID=2055889 RepID=A0ABX8CYQ1_9NOCA|nr:hypothetical protein KHQ06_19685 [Nocardia tengchongensis]